jgi:quercetin dioxygenase-like cupin family protein
MALAAAAALLALAAAVSLNALGQGKAEPVERAILERHDQSAVPGKEIVIGTVTLAPGAVVGFHTHPGDEAGYVLKGTLIWKVRGQPDKTLKAGDSFFNPRGSAHSIVGGDGGAAEVSSWIVDKGKPMSEPVPGPTS